MGKYTSPLEEDRQFWTSPIFFPILAFIAGIGISEYYPLVPYSAYFGIPVGLAAYFSTKKRAQLSLIGLVAICFSAGSLHYACFNRVLPSDHIKNFVPDDRKGAVPKVHLTGWVYTPAETSWPEKTFPYHSDPSLRTRFLVQAQEIRIGQTDYPATGLVQVTLPGMIDCYYPGQQIKITGRLSSTDVPVSDFPFPGQAHYSQHNGIFARLYADSPEDIAILSTRESGLDVLLNKGRQFARSLLLGNDQPRGESTTGLLMALILGDRYRMQNELNQAMIKIGAAHFLAVSGFNLAVLAGGFWFLCSCVGLSRKITTVVIILTTLVYAFLTDLQPSVVRATVMIVIISLGTLFRKETNALHSLTVAALVLLVINPNQLFNPGFQLSFASCLGLILLAGPLYRFMFVPKEIPLIQQVQTSPGSFRVIFQLLVRGIEIAFCSSIAAGIATIPLVMVYFKFISLMGPISSVVLFIPSVVLTMAGFVQLVMAIFFPLVGGFLAYINDYVCQGFTFLAMNLSKIPGSSFDVPPPAWYLTAGYFAIIFYPVLDRHARPFLASFRLPLLLVVIAIYLGTWLWGQDRNRAWVYVPADSEGQAVMVYTGQDLLLVDCGAWSTGKLGELVRSASCRFMTQPQAVVLTTPSQQYFNDLWSIRDQNPQIQVFTTPGFDRIPANPNDPVKILHQSGLNMTSVTVGDEVSAGKVKINPLFPPKLSKEEDFLLSDMNRTGVVLVEQVEMKTVIGTCLNSRICSLLSRNYPDLRADTLIFGSGSQRGGSLERLIAQLRPKQIVISGRLRSDTRQWYQSLSKKVRVQVRFAADERGVLIEK